MDCLRCRIGPSTRVQHDPRNAPVPGQSGLGLALHSLKIDARGISSDWTQVFAGAEVMDFLRCCASLWLSPFVTLASSRVMAFKMRNLIARARARDFETRPCQFSFFGRLWRQGLPTFFAFETTFAGPIMLLTLPYSKRSNCYLTSVLIDYWFYYLLKNIRLKYTN